MEYSADSPEALPAHVENSVQSIIELHAEHHKSATKFERLTAQITAFLGTPQFMMALYFATVVWMIVNLIAQAFYSWSIDPPPFSWLSTVSSLISVYMVVLVLATQRRDDRLAERRDQLTLELAILNEQKVAKVIRLLEESRRDNPFVPNRYDPEAEAMSKPADPGKVLVALSEVHAQLEDELRNLSEAENKLL